MATVAVVYFLPTGGLLAQADWLGPGIIIIIIFFNFIIFLKIFLIIIIIKYY